MPALTPVGSAASRRTAFALAVLAVVLIGLSVTAAGPWPPLRQGMWEISRTMQSPAGGPPKAVTTKRCMAPGEEWDRQHAQLTKAGCRISPVTQRGGAYTFTSSCSMMGVSSNTTTTIVAEGDSAYTLTVEGQTEGQPTKEKVTAKRVGDCTR